MRSVLHASFWPVRCRPDNPQTPAMCANGAAVTRPERRLSPVGTIDRWLRDATKGAAAPSEALTSISLPVAGMTCAACARAIERTLTRLPGVDAAAVNYATGRASVRFDPSLVQLPGIADAVRDVGYQVIATGPGETLTSEADIDDAQHAVEDREYAALKRLFILAVACGAPLVGLGMSHAQFPGVNWVQLALAVPVLFVAGRRFYRGAWSALRHRHADMNTLIALGTGAAFAYSLAVTIAPRLAVLPHTGTTAIGRPRSITRWRQQSSFSSCSDGCWNRGHGRAPRTRFDD